MILSGAMPIEGGAPSERKRDEAKASSCACIA